MLALSWPATDAFDLTVNVPGSQKRKVRKERQHSREKKRERRVKRAERKIEGWVAWTENKLFQPAVAGGIFAVGTRAPDHASM
jgi:hypothetical protein